MALRSRPFGLSAGLSTGLLPTLIAVALTAVPAPASAGITVYQDADKSLALGGLIQFAGNRIDDDADGSESDIFFRRLRPYIEAELGDGWAGKIELEFGKASGDDEVQVKDAYLAYQGWAGMTLEIGNTKTPFSREFLTSSKRQGTIERGFVGDHNFGAPDRQMGLRLGGGNGDKSLTYMVAIGAEDLDPDAQKLDFDSPANKASDWNKGFVVAGRLDFSPWGYVAMEQGDFAREDFKGYISVGAYYWANDDDNNTYTGPGDVALSTTRADVDSAGGIELSAGLRGRGVSVDAELQRIEADTVVDSFTGGIFRNGTSDIDKFQIKGGYLLTGNHWEIATRYEQLDADNYDDAWTAQEVGVNYYFRKHDLKVQFAYRHENNVFGEADRDADSILAMMQLVF